MDPEVPKSLPGEAFAVHTRGLRRRYGRTVALDGVDLTVPEGAAYLLVGPNGAGKTTALRILLDLLRPHAGEVRALGFRPHVEGAALRAATGYVPEGRNVGYGRMRVGALLEHHAAYHTGWDASYADHLRGFLNVDPKPRFGSLSKGQARRVQLLMALAHRPRLLLLDEPTDGLDPLVRDRVLGLLRRHLDATPTTMVLSTHLVHEAERLADHVGVLRRGRIRAQLSREALLGGLRRWRVALPAGGTGFGSAEADARGGPALPAPAGRLVADVPSSQGSGDGDRETAPGERIWTVWGPEGEVRRVLEAAGIGVLDCRRPTLEEAVVALLSDVPTSGEERSVSEGRDGAEERDAGREAQR